MNIQDYDETFLQALQTWGEQSQENMAIEECSELIKAICKFRRNSGTAQFDEVVDEIADVIIMMRQMTLMVGEYNVNERIEFKVNRLKERLGNKK